MGGFSENFKVYKDYPNYDVPTTDMEIYSKKTYVSCITMTIEGKEYYINSTEILEIIKHLISCVEWKIYENSAYAKYEDFNTLKIFYQLQMLKAILPDDFQPFGLIKVKLD